MKKVNILLFVCSLISDWPDFAWVMSSPYVYEEEAESHRHFQTQLRFSEAQDLKHFCLRPPETEIPRKFCNGYAIST